VYKRQTLYYKGDIEKITTSVIEEADRLSMAEIKKNLRP